MRMLVSRRIEFETLEELTEFVNTALDHFSTGQIRIKMEISTVASQFVVEATTYTDIDVNAAWIDDRNISLN